jgi:hypothetical protein
VDSFALSDNSLGALGRYDGKAYETMFEWASKRNPINTDPEFSKTLQKELRKIKEAHAKNANNLAKL